VTEFQFCPKCGDRLHTLNGRLVCQGCGYIFYRNPTGCIPCGYLEWGEEVRAGAQREFQEETGLQVEVGPVYTVHSNFHNPQSLTVGIWFRGNVIAGSLQAADDLDAADYFPLDALPENLAFPTDNLVLEQLRQES